MENTYKVKVKKVQVIPIKRLVNDIEKHKELLLLICSAISLIATAMWNIAFEIGRLGYASYWCMDYAYAPGDKQNFLVMFIITLCFTAIIIYPIYQYAKWTVLHKWAFWVTLSVNIIAMLAPFALIVIKLIFEKFLIYTFLFQAILVLFMIAFSFSMIYYPTYIDIRSSLKHTSKNQPQHKVKTINKSSLLSAFISLVIGVACLFVAAFFLGGAIAQQNEYSFLVDDTNFQFENDGVYYVILSETEEYYYQAKCKVKLVDGGYKNLFVHYNQTTICEKPEECLIVKSTFAKVEKKGDYLITPGSEK